VRSAALRGSNIDTALQPIATLAIAPVLGPWYRLIAAAHYNRGMMFIRFVGTHREYDKIDAATI